MYGKNLSFYIHIQLKSLLTTCRPTSSWYTMKLDRRRSFLCTTKSHMTGPKNRDTTITWTPHCLMIHVSYSAPHCLMIHVSYSAPHCLMIHVSYSAPHCLMIHVSYSAPHCLMIHVSYSAPFCLVRHPSDLNGFCVKPFILFSRSYLGLNIKYTHPMYKTVRGAVRLPMVPTKFDIGSVSQYCQQDYGRRPVNIKTELALYKNSGRGGRED